MNQIWINSQTLRDKDSVADWAVIVSQKVAQVTFLDAIDVQRLKVEIPTEVSEAALALSAINYLGLRTSLLP